METICLAETLENDLKWSEMMIEIQALYLDLVLTGEPLSYSANHIQSVAEVEEVCMVPQGLYSGCLFSVGSQQQWRRWW